MYDFSSAGSFMKKMGVVTELQAKEALRILVEFMKEEVAERAGGLQYEPILTQLINLKDKYLM